jgi:hypothetical protein
MEAADRGRHIAEVGMSLGLEMMEEDIKPSRSEESTYKSMMEGADGSLALGRLKSPPPKGGIPGIKTKFATPTPRSKGGMDVGQGLVKTSQSGGLRKGAVVAVKPEPKAPVPDPMLATMQSLALTLGNLNKQMLDMSTAIKDLQHEAKKPAPKPAPPKSIPTDLPPSGLTGLFYAVAFGLNAGHQGIYGTWSECATWVTGLPGNVFQKFSTLEGGNELIQQYNAGQTDRQKEARGGNLFREGLGGIDAESKYSSGPYSNGEEAFDRFLSGKSPTRKYNLRWHFLALTRP